MVSISNVEESFNKVHKNNVDVAIKIIIILLITLKNKHHFDLLTLVLVLENNSMKYRLKVYLTIYVKFVEKKYYEKIQM